MKLRYLATCPKGLGVLLDDELRKLGADSVKEGVAGVFFSGSMSLGYRICLWSRLANRVILLLADSKVHSTEDVYQVVFGVKWIEHIAPSGSLMVDFSGRSEFLRNTLFGARKVKDAIVDHFRSNGRVRPSVDRERPDLRITARLLRQRLILGIDLSGQSLNRRGYRIAGGKAPLKENIAAATLRLMEWDHLSEQGAPLLDPMCGSSTLLIEGALIALDRAPGLSRNSFGFERWLAHDSDQWHAIYKEAESRVRSQLPRGIEILGYDSDPNAVKRSRENISRLGLGEFVQIRLRPLHELTRPTNKSMANGLLVVNPPWGERMGEMGSSSLEHLYRRLGEVMSREFGGWSAAVLTSNLSLGKAIGLRAFKRSRFQNGRLELHCLRFRLDEDNRLSNLTNTGAAAGNSPRLKSLLLSDGAQTVANRLRKNLRRLKPWAKRHSISCYRVYDADIPEYAAAMDFYQGNVHVAEYAAPSNIPASKAHRRLQELLDAVQTVFDIPDRDAIAVKTRRRQRGAQQYSRLSTKSERVAVNEGVVKLLVNLHDYLDTGLFLDHRPLRIELANKSKGKHFLNLFSYTGAATLHVALAGAETSTSVDLSGTYLNWFADNLKINGLSSRRHRFIKADVRQWLAKSHNTYDVILLDPPSFSNSKGLEDFEIQRDHLELLQLAMARLRPDGILYFSHNRRRFLLAPQAHDYWDIENISARTIPEDFVRTPHIHQCWIFRHAEEC